MGPTGVQIAGVAKDYWTAKILTTNGLTSTIMKKHLKPSNH